MEAYKNVDFWDAVLGAMDAEAEIVHKVQRGYEDIATTQCAQKMNFKGLQ